MTSRIPITLSSPSVPDGRFRPSAFSGEIVPFRTTAFREGHDRIGVHVRLFSPSGDESLHRLLALNDGFDRWETAVAPLEEGVWRFQFEAFADDFATWEHAADLKIAAGVDTAVMREMGAQLFDRAVADATRPITERRRLENAAVSLRDPDVSDEATLEIVRDPTFAEFFAMRPLTSLMSIGPPSELLVERERAGLGSWYEFFPRSEGARRLKDGTIKSGTFRSATRRLPAVAAMGFDVIYLPPIHPIGRVNRKGRNNTLDPQPGDPGSPWAIGAAEGGHDAVHPDLGTMADFRAFVRSARAEGVEVALDFALQAAPDHPWVTSHPEWFTTLPDGSIAYAENPPKKYQDIYPINFDNDPTGICREVLRIVKVWMAHGVRIFRVDNPHTKPLAFWEWLLAEVRRTDPDVLFLSEAFTRPAMMHGLGAVGYHQSYTYFTWRTGKREIEDYLVEVSHESDHLMRPNFFVNTPDILHSYLQYGGPAAFKVRAALAATGSPSWGVYAGYELFEHVAVKPGSEEYLDSEKYQIRIRDWKRADAEGRTLAPYLTRLNEIRRAHPALQLLRNLSIHHSDDDQVLVFSKRHTLPDGSDDVVLVVINLDPHGTRETMIHLDMPALGLDWHDSFVAHDEITGADWSWSQHDYVRLDPGAEPAHVISVRGTR